MADILQDIIFIFYWIAFMAVILYTFVLMPDIVIYITYINING